MENIKCIGCGSKIQTKDKEKPGYLPKSVLEKNVDETSYCQRCFRLINYNEVNNFNIDSNEYLNIINEISKEDALVVKIIDIFDFSGSFISGITRITGNSDILILGNKIDLLPKSTKYSKVVHWLKKMVADEGIKPLDITLMSAKNGINIDNVLDLIMKYKKKRNVYIVGATNVGKSSFVNQLLKKYVNVRKDVVAVSINPGTTLGMIEFKLDDNTFIVDTPGLINKHQITHYLSPKSLKIITPKKEIKPLVFQLNEKQTLFFGGLARLDFLSGTKANFVAYFSNNLKIHRTKLENADKLFENHLGGLLSPPNLDEDKIIDKTRVFDFRIKDNQKYDIVFSGLGFVSVKGPVTLKAHSFNNVGIYIRKAII